MEQLALPLNNLLSERFGMAQFRLGQKEIITSILEKKDVLAVLPTGGGKSLCYQYPAVFHKKLVLVVSPLIALMNDQVASLKRMGIPAGCIHSGQSLDEKRQVFSDIRKGGEYVLYLSPERTQKDGFTKWIHDTDIALFAIDEAHCVSQWGHDFRAEYSQLSNLKFIKPNVPVLALTASATPFVLNDISEQLELNAPTRHVHGFYRPNLYYQVQVCSDDDEKSDYLRQSLLQNPTGRILVYCGTRKVTESLSQSLASEFEDVGHYHAGLSSELRTATQKAFADGGIRILIATNAFGMGIDHPNVRLVVHFQMPANIDALYQEMGRAGRDGLHSTCLMLYSKKDKGLQSFFIQQSEAPKHIQSSRWRSLDNLVEYAEGSECRHSEILTYYQDAQRIDSCGHCDVCDAQSVRKIQKPVVNKIALPKNILRKKSAQKKKSRRQENEELSPLDKMLFEDLRTWRKQKAKELDVPAFVVLSDKTLRQLAQDRPHNQATLRNIYGIGDAKIEMYGSELLRGPLNGN